MARIAIVTGGSSGIGKALCAALVARGDDVVVAARTDADVQKTARELTARGPGAATPAVVDVRDAQAYGRKYVAWAIGHMRDTASPASPC